MGRLKKGLNFKNKNVAIVNTNNSFFLQGETICCTYESSTFSSAAFCRPRQFPNHSCRKPESRLPFPRNSGLVVAVSVLKGREYLAIDSNRILHHAKILLKKFNTISNNQRKLNKYSEQGNNKSCNTISSLNAMHVLYGTS